MPKNINGGNGAKKERIVGFVLKRKLSMLPKDNSMEYVQNTMEVHVEMSHTYQLIAKLEKRKNYQLLEL